MSKYYTPEIEEFHVGFECEFKNSMQSNKWEKEVCNVDTMSIAYDSFEHEDYKGEFANIFRVKYLDREDIESLGLKLWQIPGDSFDWEFYLDSEKGESLGKVTFNDNNTIDELELFGTIFNIKNKSELKRILKQLGI